MFRGAWVDVPDSHPWYNQPEQYMSGTGASIDLRPPFPVPGSMLAIVAAPQTRVNQAPRIVNAFQLPSQSAPSFARAPYPGEYAAGPDHNPALSLGLEVDYALALA